VAREEEAVTLCGFGQKRPPRAEGFNPTVDTQRLLSIRRKAERGQHVYTLHDVRFLLAIIDGQVTL
jgi:hypothetical protein